MLSGCLSQDFEQQSLAKYKTSAGSTFVKIEPIVMEEPARPVANMGLQRPSPQGRFTVPRGNGRFTIPRGNGRFTTPTGGFGRGGFSFPSGNRFTAPGGLGGPAAGRFTWPANPVRNGGFSMPNRDGLPTENGVGGRFTWPKQAAGRNFTQPRSRSTWPDNASSRFTSPLQ